MFVTSKKKSWTLGKKALGLKIYGKSIDLIVNKKNWLMKDIHNSSRPFYLLFLSG
jgi:hypothetical protein